MAFHLSGRLICRTESEAARVRAHLPEHIRLTRAEPGCLSFAVDPTGDPLIWQIDEAFADRSAFHAHQARAGASLWARETAGIPRDHRTWET
jgi:quinol monooxygenase YgiN